MGNEKIDNHLSDININELWDYVKEHSPRDTIELGDKEELEKLYVKITIEKHLPLKTRKEAEGFA
mgnify:CR=1 FL=1